MNIIAIIPARYASTRFPGKPLAIIDGLSMIERVYNQVSKVSSINKVIVATDDIRIEKHVKEFGGNVQLTSSSHQSGTDRCAEVVEHYQEAEIILNIQGDEPFIHPKQIEELIDCFKNDETQLATLIKKIHTSEELFNVNIPKVVVTKDYKALYFSRQTIPFSRNTVQEEWINSQNYYKHIGIYGYKRNTLVEISQLLPSSLEKSESLEQLRWLENGFIIQTALTDYQSYGIDLKKDIDEVLNKLNTSNNKPKI